MIINSVGAAFAGGSGQTTGGTSSQTGPAQDDTAASGSGQTGGTEATGSSSTSSGSSNGQTGSQAGGQSTASSASSQSAASQTAATAQSAALAVEAGKAPADEDALRTQALEVQKRMNTDMLIRSLGASTGTGLSLLSEAKPETPVPLAVAAYAENFNQSAAGLAKAAA
ncbi:hypothetical protein [Hoeflea sp.]|uniref:hypothetical protein n=1 Tax=Hoeflea sp. TaxID=1940281 RepID=UPI003A92F5C0